MFFIVLYTKPDALMTLVKILHGARFERWSIGFLGVIWRTQS
jgi:hypothetical protein